MTDGNVLAFREVFETEFERLGAVFPGVANLPAGIAWPVLSIQPSSDLSATLEIAPGTNVPTITVYEPFLASLEREFEQSGSALRDACLTGVDETVARELSPTTIDGLFDFAGAFLLAHELHHHFGGHLAAYGGANRGDRLGFTESAFGMAPRTRGIPADRKASLHRRYYLEHEADSTALQTVMQAPALSPAVAALTARLGDGETSTAVFESEGEARLVLFRMMVAAFWTTVGILEQRTPSTAANATTHPLPGARLLSGVSTILEQFARFTDSQMDANGLNSRVLTDHDAEHIKEFLRRVLQPVVVARLAARGVTGREETLASPEVAFMREIGNIFQQRDPESPSGKELLAIQRLRPRMRSELAPFVEKMRQRGS